MKKPLIGITPLVDTARESYWMLPGYMKGLEEAGSVTVMLPLVDEEASLEQLADLCDGFLFAGGHDVSPAVYGEATTRQCGECSSARDRMETVLLNLVLRRDKPIFGICRGLQFITAALGGTLYQDLPTERPSEILHHQAPPYDRPAHMVKILEGSPLYQLLGKEVLPVNSYHHQAVKELSPSLQPMAYSEDGLVEAVCLPNARFLWAVQWHPEFSYRTDENSKKIFAHFISCCCL